ncbi:MAG: nucleotidyl transferase AbiEii/AbiGii toxin family protein [Verrucomicrobia bacterium]|nr:nucleotidyl transferase AbiEii/AbiGii toxin family protein [Verrucomicrobiota bacterium]MDE3100244.1 nucleotidyl transferase AbiEii/AbiGii toxin family protein [Verrucomicrobiota bacterium]
MDSVLQLTPRQRVELFEQTTQQTGIDAVIVEKDFWVCWTLKELFRLPAIGEHLIFKGGTSLSKVFKVIERFSEDIDVSIDRGFLGFGGANEPGAGGSNKEKQRRIEALKTACQQKIALELFPALEAAIKAKAGKSEKWTLRLDDDDPDKQTVLFDYPTSFAPAAAGYIRRLVKIEMGARADHWPCETRTVTPYVAEQFPKGFREPSCAIKVLSVERTFWEKATILHAEFHRPAEKPMPERFSRHYCDCYELIRKGVAKSAAAKLDLLARVAEHKNLFFKTSWARYGEAAKGTLRIMPPEHRLKALRDDYGKMQQMFFGEPPNFDTMLGTLKQWESEFNQQ